MLVDCIGSAINFQPLSLPKTQSRDLQVVFAGIVLDPKEGGSNGVADEIKNSASILAR